MVTFCHYNYENYPMQTDPRSYYQDSNGTQENEADFERLRLS